MSSSGFAAPPPCFPAAPIAGMVPPASDAHCCAIGADCGVTRGRFRERLCPDVVWHGRSDRATGSG